MKHNPSISTVHEKFNRTSQLTSDTDLTGTERENMLVSKKRKHNRFLPLFLCQIANQKHLECRRLLRQCSVARIAQTPFLKVAKTVE